MDSVDSPSAYDIFPQPIPHMAQASCCPDLLVWDSRARHDLVVLRSAG